MSGDIPENMLLSEVDDWPAFADAVEKAHARGVRDDWLILDRADEAWNMIQDWYEESHPRFREEPHGAGWGMLNKLMRKKLAMQLTSFPGHVLITGHVKAITQPKGNQPGDAPEIRAEFGPYGVRPAGWKHMMKYMHTILWLQQERTSWNITTMRERRAERERLVDTPITDFTITYLMQKAKWRP
jgi:hypothetical protein